MDKAKISSTVRTMQLITVGLVMGIAMFATVTIVARSQPDGEAPNSMMLTTIALGFAVVMILARTVVPRMIATTIVNGMVKGKSSPFLPASANRPDAPIEKRFVAAYQTTLIIGHAMVEAPAFLLLVSFMLEGQWVAFGGGAAMALLMLAGFPTLSGVSAWIEQQQVRLRDEGSFDNWVGGESQPG